MKTSLRFALIVAFWTGLLASEASAGTEKTWISSNGQTASGSPVIVKIVKTDNTGTELEITMPGLFDEPAQYANRNFRRLTLPQIETAGVGFPDRTNPRGWWEFPAKLNQLPKAPSRYTQACDGSVRTFFFPREAEGKTARTEETIKALGADPEGAKPQIPRVRACIAVSRSNTRNDLSLQTEILESRVIKLAAPVVPAGFGSSDAEFSQGYAASEMVDETFYNGFQGTYVGSEPVLGEVNSMGAFAGAPLSFPAYQVLTPDSIRIIGKYRVIIKHLKGTEDFVCPLPWDVWSSLPPFLNGQAILDALTVKGFAIEASRSAHYLILTPSKWYSILKPLAQWKSVKGLNVDFAFVGSAAGDDVTNNRNAIDAYIEKFFQKNYCHGVYVLICGDVDVVQSGRSSLVTGSPDGASADSDHVYEVIGSDKIPSVYVGRLSANTDNELKVQVDKILRYERTPPSGDWPRRATLCANSQNDSGSYGVNPDFPSKYAKAVQDTVTYGGYTNPPIFQTLHAGALNASVVRATNADVTAAINAGRGLLLYRGHGDEDSWASGWDGSGSAESSGSSWTRTTNVSALTNTVHPIVLAINCLNSRVNQNDCIAEAWMQRDNTGAVAHFGATVTSYTAENHERTKGIFRAFYESGFTRLAPALAEGERISLGTSGGGGEWDSNTFAYMLLGDPEMTVRRKPILRWQNIGEIAATALIEGVRNGSLITILDPDKKPDPTGFVRVVDLGGNFFNGFADADGTVSFPNLPKEGIARIDIISEGLAYGVLFLKEPSLVPEGMTTKGFRVRLPDLPTATFEIFGSSDLTRWTSLGFSDADGPDQVFIDPGATRVAKRFYRAVQVVR